MGTDIHIFAEIYKDGEWKSAVPIIPHPKWWYDDILDKECDDLGVKYGDSEFKTLEKKYKAMEIDEILSKYDNEKYRISWHCQFDEDFDERNYSWFSILSDGLFASYEQNFGTPKGLPNDISKEIKKISDQWHSDGHSHSWLTLHELLEFDWDQKIEKIRHFNCGWYYRHYKNIKENNIIFLPDSYRDNMMLIPEHLMMNLVLGFKDFFIGEYHNYFVKKKLYPTYRKEVGEKYIDSLLTTLKSFGKPDNVRIIFWFDN